MDEPIKSQPITPPVEAPQAPPQPPVEPEVPQVQAPQAPVEPPAEAEPEPERAREAFDITEFNEQMAEYLAHFGFEFSREATLTGRILTLGEARQKR